MQKTIIIDEKPVVFKATAAFPILYKKQFGDDILTILLPVISNVLSGVNDIYKDKVEEGIDVQVTPGMISRVLDEIYSLEFIHLLNLIWTMAKLGNDDIEEPFEWFNSFNEFPIFDIAQELAQMLLPSLISKKKLETLKNLLTKKTKKQ